MGSSSEPGERSAKSIDASVGGLVWVRRRNGSWWPGRILGLDELAEGCLVSPRSGTPVKLLGREDASVDWYNLEKSKRVKAFRCGDYDECIEKAKASATNANKKAVKYARREDAIIHALEIENALLGKGPNFSSRNDNSSGEHGNSPGKSPNVSHSNNEDENGDEDTSDEVSNPLDNSKSEIELPQSSISFGQPNNLMPCRVQPMNGRIRKTPNDSEDDGTEGIKRMRGLEDLGMGVVSKRKGQAVVAQQDSASLCGSNNVNSVSDGSPANGSVIHSSLKRKRSHLPNAHEFSKRRNRRRPLTKVLESTAMVSVPVKCDQLGSASGSPLRGISDSKLSELEHHESEDIPATTDNNLDSTVVSSENGGSDNACKLPPEGSHVNHKTKENEISSISGLPVNDSSEMLFDVPFVEDDKHFTGFPPNPDTISSGKPENSQAEALNEVDATSSAGVVHVSDNTQAMDKWQSKGKRRSRNVSKNKKQDSTKKTDVDDEPSVFLPDTEHLNGVSPGSERKLDCDSMAKSKLVGEEQADGFPDWSRHKESQSLPRSRPYRQSRFTVNSKYQMSDFPSRSFCADSQLYDVNLEVKASYRPQHVPLVSLMSKLNGKAIIGHPLTVEALELGSSDLLMSTIVDPKDNLQTSKPRRAPAKHLTLQSRYSKSKSKSKSGHLSKKTRKLSSLTSSHKQGGEQRKPVVEKLKGTAISCIPLKLVFSRINEAVTRRNSTL